MKKYPEHKFDASILDLYVDGITDKFHRYKSWDHCYKAFADTIHSDLHSLHLAFFLASWGMYRGSGELLQRNHLMHQEAAKTLLLPKYYSLRCTRDKEITLNDIQTICELRKALLDNYNSAKSEEGKDKQITDTLLSKAILGTLGCVPAYDRYVIAGLKELEMKPYRFNKRSLEIIFNFIELNKPEILFAQKTINDRLQIHYPLMKIVDMYLWQVGYNKLNPVLV